MHAFLTKWESPRNVLLPDEILLQLLELASPPRINSVLSRTCRREIYKGMHARTQRAINKKFQSARRFSILFAFRFVCSELNNGRFSLASWPLVQVLRNTHRVTRLLICRIASHSSRLLTRPLFRELESPLTTLTATNEILLLALIADRPPEWYIIELPMFQNGNFDIRTFPFQSFSIPFTEEHLPN